MSNEKTPFSDWLLATERGVLKRVCQSVGSPRALAVKLLAEAGEWGQLIALAPPDKDPWVNPGFADDYLVSEMMRKNPRIVVQAICGRTGLQRPVNRKHAAMRSWVASERKCREVNERLLLSDSWAEDEFLSRVVKRTRRRIARTLGPLDSSTLETIKDAGRHGPGATSTIRGSHITPANKMISLMGITPLARALRGAVTPLWDDETVGFVVESWDTWINVPKHALTDRGISINPGFNVYLQLGVGDVIRQRLRDAGLDIRSGQQRHKWLVRLAQRLGLSTIDLSAASDSISREVVRLLLPRRWFHMLELLRTFHTRIHGITVATAKFAAMGNGYTFELETLIFWALAVSTNELLIEDGTADVRLCRFVSVYGDDIIVPRDTSGRLIEVLDALGFSTNIKKTFLAGAFFESCGSDVWNDQDVRPFYLDAEPRDRTEAVILIANSIRLYAARRGAKAGCDKRFLNAWLYAVSRCEKAQSTGVPVEWERKLCHDIERVPSASAASGLIRNFDEFMPKTVTHDARAPSPTWHDRGWITVRGVMYYFPPINYKSTDYLYHVGCYIVALHSGSPETTRAMEPVRGAHRPGRLKSMEVLNWTDIGPWVDLHG